jgi:transcription elongation factor/antiterminator RfaH
MKEPMFAAAWYCVRTQPKSEHIAAAHLRLLEGVEVFCPRLRLRKVTRRGPVWFVEALFPGYLFARFDPLASQNEVTHARGVSTIVRFKETPASVPDEAIAELRKHMDGTECKEIDQSIREGDSVVVAQGMFMGLTTVVTQALPARERVRVLVEFLGQCREVEVSKASLLPDRAHFLTA